MRQGVRPAHAQVSGFLHVFVIVFENEEASDIIGNPAAPYFNQLADTHGLATNTYAITHPSLPNYDCSIATGDAWLALTVAGTYTFAFRVASSGAGGTFHVEMNGVNVTGSISIPDTAWS